eukprot:TRINITY_DN4445_c0_g1_i4.p1 TRINITY_DN4445_c0_g1~~TRINITY_DN4445_c0_g1_i4.p1  ORF type:complete len:210 (-),score=42.36 TRINITY_DN4445_c0_g1_i4:275-904(-)
MTVIVLDNHRPNPFNTLLLFLQQNIVLPENTCGVKLTDVMDHVAVDTFQEIDINAWMNAGSLSPLSYPTIAMCIDPTTEPIDSSISMEILQSPITNFNGTEMTIKVDAIAYWFAIELEAGVFISTGPTQIANWWSIDNVLEPLYSDSPTSITVHHCKHRQAAFLPSNPIDRNCFDQLFASAHIESNGCATVEMIASIGSGNIQFIPKRE